MTGKKVLFVCYGGGHATMIAPVVAALHAQSPELETIVIGLTTAHQTFDAANISFLGFKDLVIPKQDGKAIAHGEKLIDAAHSDHTGISREESIAYLGLSYADLVAENGEADAEELYAVRGRQCFLPLGILRRVMDRFQPDFVVTTTSPRAELAARHVANERNIPSMAITDVLGKSHFVQELCVDHLCVNSRTARENYSAAPQVKAGTIHLVGNPAMDRMVQDAAQPRDIAWRAETFPSDQPASSYVLVAEQFGYMRKDESAFVPFTEADILANLDRVHAACRDNAAIMLVRPHPSLPPDLYAQWIRDKSGSAFLAQSQDLSKLLNASDLVISNFSTIMLDALYFNRPVLLVNYPDSGNLMPFDTMGFATGVAIENAADLSSGMQRALTDTTMIAAQQAAFRSDFAELPCAPKIADIIAEALS